MPPQTRLPQVEQVPYDYYFEVSDPGLAAAFQAGHSAFQPGAVFQPGVDTSFQDHYLPTFDPQMQMHPLPDGSVALPKWYYGHDPAATGQGGNLMPGGPLQMPMQMPMQTELQPRTGPYGDYDMGMGTDMSRGRNPG